MTFGQTEAIILVAYAGLWWLFYFFVKMRADRKYLRSGETIDSRPCIGCLVTQSAMLAAVTLALGIGLYSMELIELKR